MGTLEAHELEHLTGALRQDRAQDSRRHDATRADADDRAGRVADDRAGDLPVGRDLRREEAQFARPAAGVGGAVRRTGRDRLATVEAKRDLCGVAAECAGDALPDPDQVRLVGVDRRPRAVPGWERTESDALRLALVGLAARLTGGCRADEGVGDALAGRVERRRLANRLAVRQRAADRASSTERGGRFARGHEELRAAPQRQADACHARGDDPADQVRAVA